MFRFNCIQIYSYDELMLLQTRSSNRVSVTLRAFETLVITNTLSHDDQIIRWIRYIFSFIYSLSFSISITPSLFLSLSLSLLTSTNRWWNHFHFIRKNERRWFDFTIRFETTRIPEVQMRQQSSRFRSKLNTCITINSTYCRWKFNCFPLLVKFNGG